jgi:hypothetical protein
MPIEYSKALRNGTLERIREETETASYEMAKDGYIEMYSETSGYGSLVATVPVRTCYKDGGAIIAESYPLADNQVDRLGSDISSLKLLSKGGAEILTIDIDGGEQRVVAGQTVRTSFRVLT